MRPLLLLPLLACQGAPLPPVPDEPPPVALLSTPKASPPPPDRVVASWTDGELTEANIEARVGHDLRSRRIKFLLEEYEIRLQALESLIVDELLRREVRAKGLDDVDALLRREVESKVRDPTPQEVKEYYPIISRQLKGMSPDEAQPYVEAELIRQAQQRRYNTYIKELKDRANVEISLPYPDLPRVEIELEPHNPTQGPSDAPVTIVQFAEYQCFYCNKARPTLQMLLQDYPDQIRLVWKDFPLSNHGRALPAAMAARCAGEQGKYWELSERLLANQHALSDADITGHAEDLGLDTEALLVCMDDSRHESAIRSDVTLGRKLGISATPTFFINGVLLSGAQPVERFRAIIDRELER